MSEVNRFMAVASACLILVATLGGSPAARAQSSPVPPVGGADAVAKKAPDSDAALTAKLFSGTAIVWRNVTSVQSMDPSLAQTYNPYFGMGLQFRLQVWPILEKLYVSTTLGVVREFTHSDSTTQAGETLVSDVALRVGTPALATIPGIEVDLGASATVTLPSSKSSRFKTQLVALTPALSLSKRFGDVLAGLSIGYSVAGTFFAHEFTTGGNAPEGVSRCGDIGVGLEELQASSCLNSGVRNAQIRLVNSLSFGIDFIAQLGLSVSVSFIHDFLYPQGADVTGSANYSPTEGRDIRHYMAYGVELRATPWRPLTIALGVQDVNALFHSDPNKPYRHPFDPFSTELYLDLRLDVAQLVIAILDS